MKKMALIIISLAALLQALPSDTCNQNTWVTNGPVSAIAPAGDKVFIGGNFTRVGPCIGGVFDRVFDTIHSVVRNNIAALDATTGEPTAWNPNANSGVQTLTVSGTTVYAGGDFTIIDGQSRNHIAALDATTGNATSWNPNANGNLISDVLSIAVSGTTVYVGGLFDSIGGQSRKNIGALDATTGNALGWNPDASDGVYSLAVSGTTIYVGGAFNTIGAQTRNYIAALEATTGNVLSWNPNADYWVKSLAVNGTTVYAGGRFTNIGGQNRNYIAALDATTGNALAWNPNAFRHFYYPASYCIVNSITVSGTTIYAGGLFDSIGGQTRSDMAALDGTAGTVLAWKPNLPGGVYSLAVKGSTIYAGGLFASEGQGFGQAYFAQFDSTSPSLVTQPISASSTAKHAGLQVSCCKCALVKFAYSLPQAGHVSLRLYSINGQLQSELVNKHQPAGNYSLTMQRDNLASGAYLVVFKAGEYHQEKMMSLMK